ncbi:MAG TPA: prepilin-type N-terminal cleavage/methylation domain-containing protein [Planctomycetaceae bacterium]|nr:prepilin-type N-terminal cleavage/methylation domain-containing protein [Planctomycetaceae bacterium]
MRQPRRGFTLIEILIVIVILLILAGMAVAVLSGRNTDKMRSAARVAQSAFLGAKDRALHAKDLRGVRLIRDPNYTDPVTGTLTLVTGFVYLQPLPLQSTGNLQGQTGLNNFAVTRPNYPASNDATGLMVSGAQAQTWFAQDQGGIWPASTVQIRIPSGLSGAPGQWYQLARLNNAAPYWGVFNNGNLNLTLQSPFQGGQQPTINDSNAIDSNSTLASCDILLGNDILPFHQPISLSSGIVIDLKYCSVGVQSLAGLNWNPLPTVPPYIDIMFSPRGAVTGPVVAQGPLHFFLRDIQDATAGVNPLAVGQQGTPNADLNKGERMILTVFPQTGLVQTFDMDMTDLVNNSTGNPPSDGLADNPYSLAQQGKSAGR